MNEDRHDDAPVDDLSDDVTMAADPDLVDQIRRKAGEASTLTGAFGTAEVDDDVTIAAPARAARAAKRRPITATPSVPAKTTVSEKAAVPGPTATPVKRLAPKGRPVEATFVAPFEDDGVSLIEQQGEAQVADVWEPPRRFVAAETATTTVARSNVRKFALVLVAVVLLTAVATAVVILAITDGL